jgi:hypothetical protein
MRRQAVRPKAALREVSQFVGQAKRGVERLATRYETVDQTHPEGFLAVDTSAGQDQVHRVAVADEPGKADSPEVQKRHAEAATEDAEDGVYRRRAPTAC